jgi:hypothetical protein
MMWLLSENEALIFLEVSMRNFHAHTHFLMHTNAHQLFHSLAQLAKFLLSTIWSMLRSIPTVGECQEVMEIETSALFNTGQIRWLFGSPPFS